MGKIYFILFDLIRSSKILTQLIWHFKIETKLHNVFWDLTSLVLKKEITTIKNKKKFKIKKIITMKFNTSIVFKLSTI